MRYIGYKTLGLLICSILAGCHAEEIGIDDDTSNTLQLLSVSLDEDAASKAAVASIDTVNIYATTTVGSVETALSSNSLSTYIHSGGTWKPNAAQTLSGETKIYAYYPVIKEKDPESPIAVTHNGNGNHTIPVSIRINDTFKGAQDDYLYATPVTASLNQKTVSLVMKHALSKVVFEITKAETAIETFELKKIEIRSKTERLQNGAGTASMSIRDGQLNGLATSSLVTLTGSQILSSSSKTTISALLAPMSAPEMALSFILTVQVGEVERTFETGSVTSTTEGWKGEQWMAGYEYVYKMKVDKMAGSFEGVKVYKWKTGADQNTQVGI